MSLVTLEFLRQDELHGHLQQERRQLVSGRSRQVVGVDIPERKLVVTGRLSR